MNIFALTTPCRIPVFCSLLLDTCKKADGTRKGKKCLGLLFVFVLDFGSLGQCASILCADS